MVEPDSVSFVLLAAASITYSISLRRVERLRRALAEEKVPDLLSIWTFAAALTLPYHFICGIVIIAYVAEWPSRKIVGQAHPLRYLYSCGSAICACIASATALHAVHSAPAGMALAALAFSVVDIATIAIALLVAGQAHMLRMFANPKAHATEAMTQLLGLLLAVLMSWHAMLGLLVVPALLLVQRWSLRETVKVEKAFDKETGLWSATAWRIQAQQMLYDAHGHVALIIIDPDGSGSDRQILDAIGSGLKSADLVGRYGSRQIVVLIPVGRREAGLFLSTGFRADLARAGVNAPLGCATTADGELEGLLIDAMSDLMARRAAAGVDHAW